MPNSTPCHTACTDVGVLVLNTLNCAFRRRTLLGRSCYRKMAAFCKKHMGKPELRSLHHANEAPQEQIQSLQTELGSRLASFFQGAFGEFNYLVNIQCFTLGNPVFPFHPSWVRRSFTVHGHFLPEALVNVYCTEKGN